MNTSMLQVMQIEGVRFRKYVLQNAYTGIVVQNRRFWTIRGARRRANKNVQIFNRKVRKTNTEGV